MKNFSKLYFLLSLSFLTINFATITKETQPSAIFVDFDNVLTSEYQPKLRDSVLLGSLFITHPIGTAKALLNFDKLKTKGKEFSRQPNASLETTIDQMITFLKEEGYGDFTKSHDKLLSLATQTESINEMFDLLWALKKEGHILIGATNQPYNQNVIYRNQLRQNGKNLNDLFDTILTTYSENSTPNESQNAQNYSVYMADAGIEKPNTEYFEIAKAIALKYGIDCEKQECVFIDDLIKNVDGAVNAGITGIHFHKLSKEQTAKQSAQKIKEELLKRKILKNKVK